MELVAWELNLELNESILIGIDKQIFKLEESYEVDYSVYFLCVKLRLTLIYN